MAEVTSKHHHGLVIREFREKRGMTQEALAEHWRRPGYPVSQAFKYAKELEDAGYGNVQAVKEFREELMEER